jgi:hypothetical protein
MTSTAAILLMLLLVMKHAYADLNLQGRLPGDERAKLPLVSEKNLRHSLDHAVLGLLVTVWFAPLWLALTLAVAEFATHYAIDHAKSRIRFAMGWGVKDRAFWRLQGFDQMAHMATYGAMSFAIAWHW